MKKIIKVGTKKIIDCEACGCRFSYDYEDMDGNQHDGFWVTCPQCDHKCSDTDKSQLSDERWKITLYNGVTEA